MRTKNFTLPERTSTRSRPRLWQSTNLSSRVWKARLTAAGSTVPSSLFIRSAGRGALGASGCQGSGQGEEARRVDLRRHVGEHELDRLVLRDRDAEALALLRVGHALLEGGARDADGLAGDADPPPVERCHRHLETFADGADHVLV